MSDHPSNGANGKPPADALTPITAIDPAAAAPSATPEQSITPSCPATAGERSMDSRDTSRRNCARGFRAPFAWFFHATCVMAARNSSGVTS